MIYPMHCAPRCGAKTRQGHSCKSPAMKNGRCRMHGGKSTGRPIIHGRTTKAAKAERKDWTETMRELKRFLVSVGS